MSCCTARTALLFGFILTARLHWLVKMAQDTGTKSPSEARRVRVKLEGERPPLSTTLVVMLLPFMRRP